MPTSKNIKEAKDLGLTQKEINKFMAGTYKNQIFIGYELYVEICKHNILLFPFIPIFAFGKLFGVGPLIYNYIAKRRYEYFGRCSLSFYDEIAVRFAPIKTLFQQNYLIQFFIFIFCHNYLYNVQS